MIEGGCLYGRIRYKITGGSLMFGTQKATADLVTIYMGSLDDPSIRAPTYAQFTRDRVSWDVTVGGLPEFHTVPPRDDNDA